jgi:starvation-inducible outer membrane lipoprotein
MKKTFILLFVVIIFVISGCSINPNLSNDFNNSEKRIDSDKNQKTKVCCKTFGYGSRMVECCQRYEWTDPDKCSYPEDLQITGGGKVIVEDSFCE